MRVAIKRREKPATGNEMPDFATAAEETLFFITDVQVPLRPEDMPGKPLRRVACTCCGESIMDGREIAQQDRTLCRPCFEKQNYYHVG